MNMSERPGEALPYVCDDCTTGYRHAISAAMCCSPLNDIDDLAN